MSAWVDQVFCEDALAGLARIPDGSIDLILTDPPYNLGKDYGNASDQQSVADYLAWTEQWVDKALPKLKPNGSLYIFLTWRFSPEIFGSHCAARRKFRGLCTSNTRAENTGASSPF